MVAFPDVVTVQRDVRQAGEELPTWSDVFARVPCTVVVVRGDETYRGRQLEANIDYVVMMQFDYGMNLQPTDRLKVVDSLSLTSGALLNIAAVHHLKKGGKRLMLEVYTRELLT